MYGTNSYGGTTNNGYFASNSYAGHPTMNYTGASQSGASYVQPEQPHFSLAENFLAENRPTTPMVSELGDIKETVEKTYELITGQEFPHESIKILVCDETRFRNIHNSTGGAWSDGIAGFSFNQYGKGISEIYVRQDHLDSVLLTIGHEIGHVLSPTLPNKHDEEAKAHAFSLAWMETIREHNIDGLQPNIVPNPAHNGLHDVSFDFVKYLLNNGTSSYDIFKTLAYGLTSMIGV